MIFPPKGTRLKCVTGMGTAVGEHGYDDDDDDDEGAVPTVTTRAAPCLTK